MKKKKKKRNKVVVAKFEIPICYGVIVKSLNRWIVVPLYEEQSGSLIGCLAIIHGVKPMERYNGGCFDSVDKN